MLQTSNLEYEWYSLAMPLGNPRLSDINGLGVIEQEIIKRLPEISSHPN